MTLNREKTCCFTGHRVIPKDKWTEIENQTESICKKLIEKGVENFIVGGALGFDTISANCVLRLRTAYENIRLIVAVPCENQSKNWSENNKKIYENILKHADAVEVLSQNYEKGCMLRRNRFMVDKSKYCVAYLKKITGGTAYTVRYAVDEGLEMLFIE